MKLWMRCDGEDYFAYDDVLAAAEYLNLLRHVGPVVRTGEFGLATAEGVAVFAFWATSPRQPERPVSDAELAELNDEVRTMEFWERGSA